MFGISFISLSGNETKKGKCSTYKKVEFFFITLIHSGNELIQKPDIQNKIIKVIVGNLNLQSLYVIRK